MSFRNNNVIYWNRLVRFITQFKEYRISSEKVNDIYAKLLSVQIEESKENKKASYPEYTHHPGAET